MTRKERFRQEAIRNADILNSEERLENHYMEYDLVDMYEKGANFGYATAITEAVDVAAEYLNAIVPKYVSRNITKGEIKSYILDKLDPTENV